MLTNSGAKEESLRIILDSKQIQKPLSTQHWWEHTAIESNEKNKLSLWGVVLGILTSSSIFIQQHPVNSLDLHDLIVIDDEPWISSVFCSLNLWCVLSTQLQEVGSSNNKSQHNHSSELNNDYVDFTTLLVYMISFNHLTLFRLRLGSWLDMKR